MSMAVDRLDPHLRADGHGVPGAMPRGGVLGTLFRAERHQSHTGRRPNPLRYRRGATPTAHEVEWSRRRPSRGSRARGSRARLAPGGPSACTVHVPLVCTRGSHGRAAHAHAAHASTWLTRWGNHAVHASRWLTRRGRLTPTRLTHPTTVVHTARRFTPTRASRGRSGLHSRPVNYGASNSFRAHLRSYTSISGRPGRASTLYRTRPASKGFWGSGLLACGMVFSKALNTTTMMHEVEERERDLYDC